MSLPFTVEQLPVPAAEAELEELRALRALAYGRRLPDVERMLRRPDPADDLPGTILLAARDKESRRLVGSVRLVSRADGPLPMEASVRLPGDLTGLQLLEATRLVVDPGYSPQDSPPVSALLFKAVYLAALEAGAGAIVLAARGPMADRYADVGFAAILGGRWVPLDHLGGLEHRIFAFRLGPTEARLTAAGHPFVSFVLEVRHPDLKLSGPTR